MLGLVTLLVGLGMARGLDAVRAGPLHGIILALVSLALDAVVGELLEERLTAIGEAARREVGGGGRFTEAFVTASLLFCIGPMAIVGSIQNRLTLDAQTLVPKSSLDGTAAVALAGVYGAGVGVSPRCRSSCSREASASPWPRSRGCCRIRPQIRASSPSGAPEDSSSPRSA